LTFHDGIPEPYNHLPDGQFAYVWQEAAKARIAELVGCSAADATLVLSEVVSCACRGHAHEPIRTQALREAARAHRIYPGDDPVAQMRHAISTYFGTLNLAGRLNRGELDQEEAARRIKAQREEMA
jgi:hypothetical protein